MCKHSQTLKADPNYLYPILTQKMTDLSALTLVATSILLTAANLTIFLKIKESSKNIVQAVIIEINNINKPLIVQRGIVKNQKEGEKRDEGITKILLKSYLQRKEKRENIVGDKWNIPRLIDNSLSLRANTISSRASKQ